MEERLAVTLKNEYNKKLSNSQRVWLERFLLKHEGKVIEVAITKGGYLSVDFKRESNEYPYGREIRGIRGGWISSLQGRRYDFESNAIIDGVIHDSTFGIKRFSYE